LFRGSLGKFGLGLKTASLSQCSRLTVASRTDRTARRIEVRQWDLAHVEKSNRWEIINVPAGDRPGVLVEPLQETTGTVVLWELLDRVLGYKVPWGEHARNGFLRLADELDQHLGMVFHRFLSGEARRRKTLRISLNGTAVEAWDPFATDERATCTLPEKQLEIHGDAGPGLVACTPYILPRQDQFSSLKAFNRYAGPRKWNYQQGFYIYRADRLIQCGGWSYMRTADEHTKLARVALDFWPDLDSAFDLNVAKARVNLPADLRSQLQPLVEQVVKQARTVYSTRSAANPPPSGDSHRRTGTPAPAPGPARGPDEGPPDGNPPSSSTSSPAGVSPTTDGVARIGQAIDNAALSAGELDALKRIKRALRTHDPRTANEIGW
jgi:hypothetical protein